MANINNVINIDLREGGALAQRDNLNIVSIITSEFGFLSTAKRFSVYEDIGSVAADFGTESQAYAFAQSFFATSPNPINVGGRLVIGYWRAVDENVPATAAVLTSSELSEAVVIGQLQQISDGSFDITIDGTLASISGLDFRTSTTLADVVSILNTAVTDATVTLSDNKIVFTSNTTGVASTITYLSSAAGGTFIGTILGLEAGSGASIVAGADAAVLTAETKLQAITELKAQINVFGSMFIDKPTSVEAKSLAEYAQASGILLYDVFSSDSNLLVDVTNVVWDIVLSGLKNYRCLFDSTNNRRMAVSYMARTHVVDFRAQNSAITMHLKTLSVPALEYSQDTIDKAKRVGLDLYTTIKNVPVVLTSGVNDFVDNRYNLLGFVDALQTDLFNVLKSTPTKIAQTIQGVNALVDQAEKTTAQFVRAAVFAPGTWTSTDTFGNIDTFNRNIEENGYYWLSGRLSDQDQADRELRKSPTIQGAVKEAGAIHSANIIVNVNK